MNIDATSCTESILIATADEAVSFVNVQIKGEITMKFPEGVQPAFYTGVVDHTGATNWTNINQILTLTK